MSAIDVILYAIRKPVAGHLLLIPPKKIDQRPCCSCGYCLEGLRDISDRRCPECGTAFTKRIFDPLLVSAQSPVTWFTFTVSLVNFLAIFV